MSTSSAVQLFKPAQETYENNCLLQALCATPFLGAIPAHFMQSSLLNKIDVAPKAFNREGDNERLKNHVVDLIKIKNKIHTASIVRQVLNTALMIAGLVLGLFPSYRLLQFTAACIQISISTIHYRHIQKNKDSIYQIMVRGDHPNDVRIF